MLHGIPGSQTNHHGVPYSLTEEFVAVYRMHPLIPDEFAFRSVDDDRVLAEHELPDIGVLHVRERLSEVSMANLFYSFGALAPRRDHAAQLSRSTSSTSSAPTAS